MNKFKLAKAIAAAEEKQEASAPAPPLIPPPPLSPPPPLIPPGSTVAAGSPSRPPTVASASTYDGLMALPWGDLKTRGATVGVRLPEEEPGSMARGVLVGQIMAEEKKSNQ